MENQKIVLYACSLADTILITIDEKPEKLAFKILCRLYEMFQMNKQEFTAQLTDLVLKQ